RIEQRPLGGRKLVFGENGDAGRRHLLGGLFGRHGASCLRFRSCCGGGFFYSSDFMVIGTTVVGSMTPPMSTLLKFFCFTPSLAVPFAAGRGSCRGARAGG